MPEDQDLQVPRAVVGWPAGEQSGQRPDDEGQEEEHRGIVEEPLVRVRIGVSDPHGPIGRCAGMGKPRMLSGDR